MTINIVYKARKLFKEYHQSKKRFNLLCIHRRAGKTTAFINQALIDAIQCPHPAPNVAYIAPYLKQAKDIAWDYLKSVTANLGAEYNEAELRVDFCGRRIRLYGADNYESLRGKYFDAAFLDEYAFWKDDAILSKVIMPMLADRIGRLHIASTPNGENHFYDRFLLARNNHEWFSMLAKASETGIIPQNELDLQRRELSESQYNQEFECSFSAAITGSVYGAYIERAEQESRIISVKHDPNLPVYAAWDLGMRDSMAIWVAQQYNNELRLIDYIEDKHKPLSFYIGKIQETYKNALHILPHDVMVRELTTGMTRLEAFAKIKPRPRVMPNLSVADGIEAARVIFGKCWFDRDKCSQGIRALRNYQWINMKPEHDEYSHAADAFRYLALAKKLWNLKPEEVLDNNIVIANPTYAELANEYELSGDTYKRL